MELLILLVSAGLLALVSKMVELWLEYHSGLFQRGNSRQIGLVVLGLVLVLVGVALWLQRGQALDREAREDAANTNPPRVVAEASEARPRPQAQRAPKEQKTVEARPVAKEGPKKPPLQPPVASEKQGPAAAENKSEKQVRPRADKEQTVLEDKPPVTKAPGLRPDRAPTVSPQVLVSKPPPKSAPPQGEGSTVPTKKPHIVHPDPPIVVRYRPRTFPVHVVETETASFEEALGKYGLRYTSTTERSTPKGPRWHVYHCECRWYQTTVSTPQQLTALEEELKGLWERFRFRVEVRR